MSDNLQSRNINLLNITELTKPQAKNAVTPKIIYIKHHNRNANNNVSGNLANQDNKVKVNFVSKLAQNPYHQNMTNDNVHYNASRNVANPIIHFNGIPHTNMSNMAKYSNLNAPVNVYPTNQAVYGEKHYNTLNNDSPYGAKSPI